MDIITMIIEITNQFLKLLFAISDFIWALLVPLLLLTGLFFTFRTKFLQIRFIPEMFRSLGVKKEGSEESISGLQAFFVGLASRVGTGNIAGVAIAISLGGAGSVFWMWVVALLGSVSAFVESTLAQLYKVEDSETKFRGGPAYYISRGLNNKPLAITFAVLISIAFGLIFNAVQANTITTSISSLFMQGSPIADVIPNISSTLVEPVIGGVTLVSLLLALILATLVAVILFKGAKTIANVTTVIVPIMAILYVLLAIVILIVNHSQIIPVFQSIFTEAFSAQALAGGLSGAVIQNGVKRGLFSNEAGMGSAPNAAASADVDHPITQGLIQTLGVFVDTIIVCSATAFILLSSGIDLNSGLEGIQLTQQAIFVTIGQFGVYFLTIAIFFFAFSSILGNYFYSQSNIEFISDNKNTVIAFKGVVIFMVVFGSLVNAQTVWNLADLFMGLMALVNIYAIISLHPKVIALLKDYQKQRKAKQVPKFNANDYDEFKEFDLWKTEE